MHNGVKPLHAGALIQFAQIHQTMHHIMHLARIGDIGNAVVNAGVIQRLLVHVQHLMPLIHQIGDHMPPRLAAAAGE